MAGLYLHIPFCKQRCIYCDFYFVTSKKHIEEFVNKLVKEIGYWGTFFGPKQSLDTIYFGGGTPSLLPAEAVAEILHAIDLHFDTTATRERSFELNPDDVDDVYLRKLRQTGINRLSIGVQSFFSEDLKWMNRAHSAEEADNIVPQAREAGFDNFSVDLIFGLPEQNETHWIKNLTKVISLDVPHLSTYGLTIEPKTPLYKQVAQGIQHTASDQTLAHLYQQTMDVLREAGYEHYEISSFSRPDCRSQHNQLYWQHTNYLGIGPSAHSFWQMPGEPAYRWANVRNLKKYFQWNERDAPPQAFKESVEKEGLANEYIMLRLRTRDGLDLDVLSSVYGTQLPDPILHPLLNDGLATVDGHILSLTDRGLLVCDAITAKFFNS
ncbi:MAG: radical SAM family heme chaperone HemW [Rhodothermales bacterium]